MPIPQIIAFIVMPGVAYLLGSVPFGLLIGWAKGVDIRKAGSGNIGATNLGRVCGKKYFFYAFLLDAAKGFVPTLAAGMVATAYGLPAWTPLVAAASAVLGHLFPIFLKFKGGKGVSTSLGVVLGVWPICTLAGLGALVGFIFVFMIWRYISVASIVGTVIFTLLVLYLGVVGVPFQGLTGAPVPWPQLMPLLITGLAINGLIIVRHRSNIRRLMNGTEPKFGRGKK